MPDDYLLLTPLFVFALVALLVFAGCAVGTADVAPIDVLLFVDFVESEVSVPDVTLAVRWLTPAVSVGGTRNVSVTSNPIAFLAGVLRPPVTDDGAGGLNVRHRWDPGVCRITFVNVPINLGATWDLTCTLSANVGSPRAPRTFTAMQRVTFSTTTSDPLGLRCSLSRATGDFVFSFF
jgi:hypothetical protein